MASIKYVIELSGEEKEQLKAIVPFPVSWTVKMKKKQKIVSVLLTMLTNW